MSDDLNRRNTESVRQALTAMQEMLHAQQARIDALSAAVSGLTERIVRLEAAANTARALMSSRGPSVTE